MEGGNQKVTKKQLKKIRNLKDFDLIMFISELHDFGWPRAAATLTMIPPADSEEEQKLAHQKASQYKNMFKEAVPFEKLNLKLN